MNDDVPVEHMSVDSVSIRDSRRERVNTTTEEIGKWELQSQLHVINLVLFHKSDF